MGTQHTHAHTHTRKHIHKCITHSQDSPLITFAHSTHTNTHTHHAHHTHSGTSGAVPLGMYASIVAVWFLISIPLTFVGGFMALNLPIPHNPVKTNQIPRHIPPPSAGAHPTLLLFVGGCQRRV